MESFSIQRSLLNPKFESYKLGRLSQNDPILRYELPYKASRVAPSGAMPLTFQEMQSRISHNHLCLSSETAQALYVDSENRVIMVTLANPPTFRIIYDLPRHLPASAPNVRSEYPSAAFFRSDVVFVADGHGLLHVLSLTSEGNADVLGVLTVSPGPLYSPFRIHTLHQMSPNIALLIVSARYYDPNLGDTQRSLKPGDIQFDVCAIRVDLSILNPKKVVPLDVTWQRRGKEVPVYTGYDSTLDAFLLIGGSAYRETTAPVVQSYEPSPDEYVPIPRANESIDSGEQQVNPKPHPYSWMQTSDSITIGFPLPSNTPKSGIKVTFSPKTLTLHVDVDQQNTTDPAVPIPEYSSEPLWDGISPTLSFWTWDREAEHSFGLLTLHLDKTNEGTRWVQVFAAADDTKVPETLDPSEMWHIREALEKYTASLGGGGGGAGFGGAGVPSLAGGEMDEEVDQSVGKESYQTWISPDGSVPAWWASARDIPFQLLSTPFPGDALGRGHTFIIKSHIDGAVFCLQSSPRWEHTSTYSALAFVLASKRDTYFTHHTDKAVFAFEGGVKYRGGNLYIYHEAPLSSKWAKQDIVKVDDGHGGSLLGVGVCNAMQDTILVCLTEGELVLVKLL